MDHACRRQRKRRGGRERPITLHDVDAIAGDGAPGLDLVALDIALTRLSDIALAKARVVEMRVFAGLSPTEVATVLGVTPHGTAVPGLLADVVVPGVEPGLLAFEAFSTLMLR